MGRAGEEMAHGMTMVPVVVVGVVGVGRGQLYPIGTTMRPCLAVELTDEQIFWAGLKHFHCDS